eukprot:superscaffoldBa00002409_g14151
MRLYSLYSHSTEKWKELKAIEEALEEHVMKPTRSQGTKIDYRRKVLSSLASNYRCIVANLMERQEDSGPDKQKLDAYWRQITSSKFVLHMAMYQDLPADLAELSFDLQADELSLPRLLC